MVLLISDVFIYKKQTANLGTKFETSICDENLPLFSNLSMILQNRNTLFATELPKWFRILNAMILLPILIWPVVAFTSCFMLDHPKDETTTLVLFYLTNAYPIYLIALVWLNNKIFKINKYLSFIIPMIFIAGMVWSIVNVAIFFKTSNEETIKAERIAAERKKLGFINDDNDAYKVLEGKLYYKDTFVSAIDTASIVALADDFVKDSSTVFYKTKKLLDADAETFKTCYDYWQQDKNHSYKNGQIVPNADAATFQAFNEYYAADAVNIFYQTETIKDASRPTFEIIKGTLNARDYKNCYHKGKIVDCKTILK